MMSTSCMKQYQEGQEKEGLLVWWLGFGGEVEWGHLAKETNLTSQALPVQRKEHVLFQLPPVILYLKAVATASGLVGKFGMRQSAEWQGGVQKTGEEVEGSRSNTAALEHVAERADDNSQRNSWDHVVSSFAKEKPVSLVDRIEEMENVPTVRVEYVASGFLKYEDTEAQEEPLL